MELLWNTFFVISRSFKKTLGVKQKNRNCGGHCAEQPFFVTRHGTNLGFTQHFETQPCDSKHVSRTTTLCVQVIDIFKSSHHRLSEIRQPKRRRKLWVLSNRLVEDSPRCIPILEPPGVTMPSPQHFVFEVSALLSDGFWRWRLVHVAVLKVESHQHPGEWPRHRLICDTPLGFLITSVDPHCATSLRQRGSTGLFLSHLVPNS